MTTYYYAAASQKYLFEDEPFPEVIKERKRHYADKGLEKDFWVVKDPAFMDAPSQKDAKDATPQPCAAIISTNKKFITWLKLRLEYVYLGEFDGPTDEIPDPIKSVSGAEVM